MPLSLISARVGGSMGPTSYLKRLLFHWGGALRKVSLEEWVFQERYAASSRRYLSPMPLTRSRIGLNFESLSVYCYGRFHWLELLHEMAHLFATDKPPALSNEVDFLGWEYSIARSLDVVSGSYAEQWVHEYRAVKVNHPHTRSLFVLGDLPPEERALCLNHHVEHSASLGLIDSAGIPLAIRGTKLPALVLTC